jgi:hypothetical protein
MIGLTLSLSALSAAYAGGGWVDDLTQMFAASNIQFSRSDSNVPFVPVAFVDGFTYSDVDLKADGIVLGSFEQSTISQGAGLPILLGPNDALMIGEWVSWNHFDAKSGGFQSFDVWSVGLPVGWLRQVDDSRQAAAFFMPLAQKASLPGSDWRIDFLGGVFGRHVESDDFWWVYGVYFDVGPGEDTYLPYLGASWELDQQWTISAVLPWPAVMYAPTRNTVFRFGAAPSGASWSLTSNQADVAFQLGNWDFGVSAQQRLSGNIWGKIEAGVGGLRSLRISGGEWQDPEFDLDASPYLSIGINFRPELK